MMHIKAHLAENFQAPAALRYNGTLRASSMIIQLGERDHPVAFGTDGHAGVELKS